MPVRRVVLACLAEAPDGRLSLPMPLYDFHCRACQHRFEALVRPGGTPACPACQSTDLERQLSTFAVSSAERTRQAADKKINKESITAARDNVAREREHEAHRKEDH